MKKNPGARGATKKNTLHPEAVELPPILDPVHITRISHDQACNVCDGGANNSELHNTKAISFAIKEALEMVREQRGTIQFRAAVSGLFYEDKRAAGDVDAIMFDGRLFTQSGRPAKVEFYDGSKPKL